MKFCKDCKWHEVRMTYERTTFFGVHILEKEEPEHICTADQDLVTGERVPKSCSRMRYWTKSECGEKGKLWEAKQ